MLKIKSYVKVKSIAEAYELNQKKTALVLGGMVWLKMGNRNISTAIDLSGLGLDTVQETDDEFVIGCMTPLRELEINKKLCNNWRKYLGTVWILGCTDNVSGNGYMGGIV